MKKMRFALITSGLLATLLPMTVSATPMGRPALLNNAVAIWGGSFGGCDNRWSWIQQCLLQRHNNKRYCHHAYKRQCGQYYHHGGAERCTVYYRGRIISTGHHHSAAYYQCRQYRYPHSICKNINCRQ